MFSHAGRRGGEEEGLSVEEIAFYDALAENERAIQVMGDEQLRVIAHELLRNVKNSVTIDWAHRESARARVRVLVKRILRKYGYPPDLHRRPLFRLFFSRRKFYLSGGLHDDTY